MGKTKRADKAYEHLRELLWIVEKIAVVSKEEYELLRSALRIQRDLITTALNGKKEAKQQALAELQKRKMMWRMEPRDVL